LAPIGTKILLYTDDTSIIVTSPNLENYEKQINKIFRDINYWFKLNQSVLNYNKTHYLQSNMKKSSEYVLKLNYHGNYVKSSPHTQFLGLIIHDSFSWKAHIDQTMSKLSTAYFVIRSLQAIMSTETLRMVYFAYVQSIMKYEIIIGGNQRYSDNIFKIQKRVIRVIPNSRMRDSCRELFQRLEILPLHSQYIFSLLIFVIKHKHLNKTNNQIHSVHTRFKTNLHPPSANLTKFQNGV
jgi:hypothetical protein